MTEIHREPFDLKLTILRLIRRLPAILLVTIAGAIFFGGWYYIRNIVLVKEHHYIATSVYKVEYSYDPVHVGDYYINEMSWNTYVQSEDFLQALRQNTEEAYRDCVSAEILTMKVDSDVHIPSSLVSAESPEISLGIAQAMEKTMMGYFAASNPQIEKISVIDPAREAPEEFRDVRPLNALILGGVLTAFFAVVIVLLIEIGSDEIWLPATVRRRYGLKCAGTAESPELGENLRYFLENKGKVGVICTEGQDAEEIARILRSTMEKSLIKQEQNAQEEKMMTPFPDFQENPESIRILRELDGCLVVIRAGRTAGKRLEKCMEFLAEQDIPIVGTVLWDADEWLIKCYYCGTGKRISKSSGKKG